MNKETEIFKRVEDCMDSIKETVVSDGKPLGEDSHYLILGHYKDKSISMGTGSIPGIALMLRNVAATNEGLEQAILLAALAITKGFPATESTITDRTDLKF